MPYYTRPRRFIPYGAPQSVAILPQMQLTGQERASLAESLAAAAERIDDLSSAESHLRAAIELRPADQRAKLARRLKEIVSEEDRRKKNTARQPVVKDAIEQDHPVAPRIARSAQ